MTDEIRITRRVALPDKYEYYEIEWTSDKIGDFQKWVQEIEDMVAQVRGICGKPSPEISPKISQESQEQGDVAADLIRADIDPSILEFKDNTVKLKTYQKDKTVWEKIHFVLKEAGYKWVAEGKESRWER